MPITVDTDPDRNLTIFKAAGMLEFEEVMVDLRAFYEGEPTSNVLVDLTGVPSVNISTDEIREIAGFKPRIDGNRSPGKTAILVDSELLFGLARMFETLSEMMDVPHAVKVFKKLGTAISWLESS